ncbi:MAG: HAMP domain-containing histidine kinase [Chitinophagaceae bacterium]|nr:HAMP domain-containing histidine kinase [Chitinophagaceae bacterium]
MIFAKNIQWNTLIRIVLLFVMLTVASFLLVNKMYLYAILTLPIIGYQVVNLYKFHNRSLDEWSGFVESIHYRDFSRYFETRQAPVDLQILRRGFNEINSTFKVLSKEKETQYQYLQKILELVDTGIISYEEESGEVLWMNESLKNMLLLSYLKTIHSLEKRDSALYEEIIKLKPRDGKVVKVNTERGFIKIFMTATAFQTEGKKYKLIAFQNVNEALEETESRAWEKLLNVMTHEIMNSIAPISSLAVTLKSRLKESVPELNNKSGAVEDLELGIDTIKRRSEGLLKFAETYRNLNKITSLTLEKVLLRDLFENLLSLMEPTLKGKNIDLQIVLKDPDLQLNVDVNLFEQVLINLVVNAAEALKNKEDGQIIISGYIDTNYKTIIKVADNGAGMSSELMDKIFIPFFTTKKNGSGIGLSLCKQILMLHKANIHVQSKLGTGTAFILSF